jgi:hypothetical protein
MNGILSRRVFGVATTLFVYPTILAVVWAQTFAENVTIQVTPDFSTDSTKIEIVEWQGDLPSQVAITLPGSEPILQQVNQDLLRAATWEDGYVDPDGWTQGVLRFPGPVNSPAYQVKYREEGPNRVAFQFQPVGHEGEALSGAILIPPGWNAPHIDPIDDIIIIIVVVILSCAAAQAIAVSACAFSAKNTCAKGVDSYSCTGSCGSCKCKVKCRQ